MASRRNQLGQSNVNVRRLLSSVRWRIRWLVFLEGLLLAFVCALVLFWLSLAADYLPVKFGFDELSKPVRTAILAASGICLLAIFYSMILKRIFVSLHDRSMALLVEKKFPEFAESLITTVESASDEANIDDQPSLLEISQDKANRLAAEVDVKDARKPVAMGRT